MRDAEAVGATDLPTASARYDGHADWYDAWAQTAGAVAAARVALEELLPAGSGPALDLGCGTGLHADVVRRRGYAVLGVDYSADQLRLACSRLPVLRADARTLPFPDGSFVLVYSMLTHTDLDRFDRLVAEGLRVLASGGVFVYVGVHPCFVGPFVERQDDALRLHRGYRAQGWQPRTAFTGTAVRHRVGIHHLQLESLLGAMLHPGTRLEAIVERGEGQLPEVLGVRLSCG
jgi:SAM-dependent methyltransferase